MDGKTVRGARRADGTRVHLLAAMTGTGLVTAQREVGPKTNEITVFRPMLADLDLADTVVTFDALHSQTAHARFLVEERKAHYIAVIKGNQPLPAPAPQAAAPAGGSAAGQDPRHGARP
ncbi:transposase [Streptomyces sp. NBC_00378]|uniref:transposase n=1 Tax=unclassified Streptomyces TaxID=2593676 RepID=UPI00224DF5B2|nr:MULTISPECIES: transposase [unclassified Streptomyces]MCX5115313.1 transposase [Streptomyces sp. NBC_00378]